MVYQSLAEGCGLSGFLLSGHRKAKVKNQRYPVFFGTAEKRFFLNFRFIAMPKMLKKCICKRRVMMSSSVTLLRGRSFGIVIQLQHPLCVRSEVIQVEFFIGIYQQLQCQP